MRTKYILIILLGLFLLSMSQPMVWAATHKAPRASLVNNIRVTSFVPRSGLPGSKVTIRCSGYKDMMDDVTDVTFNGIPATFTVHHAGKNRQEIHAIVPMGATTGQIEVTMPYATATSAVNFTIPSLGLQPVATGLSFPVYLTSPPGDNDRLFIVEKSGVIRIIKNGTPLGTPFLDISNLIAPGYDQGLMGLAFDPNYAMNGRFYVNYTETAGTTRIVRVVRYIVSDDPDIAQTNPDRVLLTIDQPLQNHYGGDILFGQDGYLYIGVGDGALGGFHDLTKLLGSLLRIDVSPEGDYTIPNDNPFLGDTTARPELWANGLRNPWRYSFDRLSGDLYMPDVGKDDREEVNVSPAEQGGGKGLNYGWNIMEGTICTPGISSPNCSQVGLTLPVLDYYHSDGCSVIGGYVYRGSAIPGIRGTYFYGDYCLGWVRSFVYQNGQAANQTDWLSLRPGDSITSFGEDAQGELYILTAQGGVYRIIAVP